MSDRRLDRERRTVHAMLALYCRHHHGGRATLCAECTSLGAHADRRLDRCPYGPDKPTCVNCPIHCYRADERDRMREFMRFAGPRMLWRHPILAIRHLLDGRRENRVAAELASPQPHATGKSAESRRDLR